jgi:hypothetical protein
VDGYTNGACDGVIGRVPKSGGARARVLGQNWPEALNIDGDVAYWDQRLEESDKGFVSALDPKKTAARVVVARPADYERSLGLVAAGG